MSELPSNWETTALSKVCERIVDGSHNPPKGTDTGFPMLSARNIQGRKINFGEYRLISETDFQVEHQRTSIRANDVLMTIVGTIGRTAVVGNDIQPIALQRSVAVLRAPNLNSQYLSYALEAPLIQKALADSAQGTAQKGVYLKTLGGIEIPLAPLPEQKRIADKLDSVLARVDACRDRLDRLPALLKRFRQSILAAATSGRLTEDWRGVNTPATGTESIYESVLLGSLIANGPQNGLYKHSSAYGSGTGILRIDMFYDGEVTGWDAMKLLEVTKAELETYGLSVDDIVVNRVNSPPYVGKSALIRELPQPCVFESNMMRIRLDKNRILPEYCIRFLSSLDGLLQLRRNVKHAVNQASINQTDVKSVEIPLPSIAEQTEIVRRVELLFAFADRLEARLATARRQVGQLTPSLLAKAFRGELVPQHPADEPASELLKRLAAQRAAAPAGKRSRAGAPGAR